MKILFTILCYILSFNVNAQSIDEAVEVEKIMESKELKDISVDSDGNFSILTTFILEDGSKTFFLTSTYQDENKIKSSLAKEMAKAKFCENGYTYEELDSGTDDGRLLEGVCN